MFTDLHLESRLLKALEKLSLVEATEVQRQVIPAALEGQDLLISAETGSGKTAAYLIPLLQRFVENPRPKSDTRALILLPTRELARQVYKHFADLAQFTGVKAGLITGGVEFKVQRAELRKNPEVVIATPGRLLEHLSANSLNLADLELLVLDEADRMLDLGFADDVLKVADQSPTERQTLLLSATLSPKHMGQVIQKVLREPKRILLHRVQDGHEAIRQQIVLADDPAHKERLAYRLIEIEDPAKAMVFCNTRERAEKLGGVLRYKGLRCAVLHGEMTQDQRNHVMQQMRQGSIRVLVATDVAARGLDITGVELVINYDMARSGDEHVHRVGRTGRAGAQGTAISLISQREWNLMASIERYLKVRFERRELPELLGKYKGPEKLKASGKAARSGKRKKDDAGKRDAKPKQKERHRDRKQIGKRRKPTAAESRIGDGFTPLRKKPGKTDAEALD